MGVFVSRGIRLLGMESMNFVYTRVRNVIVYTFLGTVMLNLHAVYTTIYIWTNSTGVYCVE